MIECVWAVLWPALLSSVFPGCEIAGEQVGDSSLTFAQVFLLGYEGR